MSQGPRLDPADLAAFDAFLAAPAGTVPDRPVLNAAAAGYVPAKMRAVSGWGERVAVLDVAAVASPEGAAKAA